VMNSLDAVCGMFFLTPRGDLVFLNGIFLFAGGPHPRPLAWGPPPPRI
jgi:hypothetical protein